MIAKKMRSGKRVVALFDFDGTITRNDSLIEFILYAKGLRRFVMGFFLMSPVILSYKIGLIPNHRAKQIVISHFFKGMPEDRFKEKAGEYALLRIAGNVRKPAMERLRWHRKEGHRVIVVSASMECWLEKWCDKNGFELIGTRLEYSNGVVTGNFATKNCYGPEKVARVKELLDLSSCDTIYAYGDSRGDRELLEIADRKFFKPFRGV